jgi:hypothetical protein
MQTSIIKLFNNYIFLDIMISQVAVLEIIILRFFNIDLGGLLICQLFILLLTATSIIWDSSRLDDAVELQKWASGIWKVLLRKLDVLLELLYFSVKLILFIFVLILNVFCELLHTNNFIVKILLFNFESFRIVLILFDFVFEFWCYFYLAYKFNL